jgi:hypothetical protein
MSNKYGIFSDVGYLSAGDPYDKRARRGAPRKAGQEERHAGQNFKCPTSKTGKNLDGTFDKMKPLFEGERYDPPDAEKRKRREAREAMLMSDAPFRPSQPMKQSSGLGDYYGCLGKPNVHLGARASESQLKKGDVTFNTSNIKTNPSKKGSYGTIGTTLGEKVGKVGAVGEYKYVGCDYESARKDAAASAKGSREKFVSNEPFKPCSPAKKGGPGFLGRTLAPKGKRHGVCGEYEYKETGPAPRSKTEKFETSFKPSQASMSDVYQPEYIPDPLDAKKAAEKEWKRKEMEKIEGKEPFRPSSFPKSTTTISVLAKNLSMAQ